MIVLRTKKEYANVAERISQRLGPVVLLSNQHIYKHHKVKRCTTLTNQLLALKYGSQVIGAQRWVCMHTSCSPSVIRTHFKKAAPKPRPKKAAAAVKPDAAEEPEEAS